MGKELTPVLERHPLLEGEGRERIKKLQDHLNLSAELGLRKQETLVQQESIKGDINELIDDQPFQEIEESDIRKLFQMKTLETKVFLENLLRGLGYFSIPIVATIIAIVLWNVFAGIHTPKNPSGWEILLFVFNLCFSIFAVASWPFIGIEIDKTFFELELVTEDINDTRMKIPYGAQLKIKEAKAFGLFTDFHIAYPKLKEIEKPRPSDPAILGRTLDGRKYLIIYWDIVKDVEKVTRKLTNLKKFKLKDPVII